MGSSDMGTKKKMAAIQRLASAATPRLQTFWRYAKVELRPPTPEEIPAATNALKNLVKSAQMGKWKTVTVKEATVNACVAAEVMCWFFIGEIIGKGTIVGYQVHPKAVDAEVSFG